MQILEIRTSRLLLRQWHDIDLGQLVEMNADPKVMEFIGSTLKEDQSKAMMERARMSWEQRGYGRFAVEVLASRSVIGFVGLAQTRIDAHFAPAVEIGWRISTNYWGHGYATEGGTCGERFCPRRSWVVGDRRVYFCEESKIAPRHGEDWTIEEPPR